jgi:hypothetical protein
MDGMPGAGMGMPMRLPPPPMAGGAGEEAGAGGGGFQSILMFLAGMGFPELVANIQKLRGPQAAKGKGGAQAPGPGAHPMMGGLPPQIAQLMAQRAALQRLSPQAPAGPGMPPGMALPGM